MRKTIEMKGYMTSYSQKNGETEDGRQAYFFGRNMHLSGTLQINGSEHYISEHGDITLPHTVMIKNKKRTSSKDPVYVPLCVILSLKPSLNQAGERRRDKGFDLFDAEIEI